MTTETRIHERAMLVWLAISTWTARKYDKQATQHVTNEFANSSDAARVNKMLLPGDAKTYKALLTLAGAIRLEHYSNTLAWSDEGWRLLTNANYMEYMTWFRKRKADLRDAFDQFAPDYVHLKDQAKRLLTNGSKSLYCEGDYPSIEDLRQRFTMKLSFMPVPAEGDVRVDLGSDQVKFIEESIKSDMQSALRNATADAWGRLENVTRKIADKLADPEGIFRDTLIENARECVDALGRLNVTNDAELDAMRDRVRRELTMIDPQGLRDHPKARRQVAAKAQAILDAMKSNGMVGAA